MGTIPQNVFWAAVDGLKKAESTSEQKSYFRRIALISLCGGIPVNLLDHLTEFTFKSCHFTSLPLPVGNFALDDGQNCNVEQTKKNEGDVPLLEAGIRVLFWDSLLIDSFRDWINDTIPKAIN